MSATKRFNDFVDEKPVEVIRENIGTPGEIVTVVFSEQPYKQNSRTVFLVSELQDMRRILSAVQIDRYQEARDSVKEGQ